jgi:hypothetical protein
MATTTNYGWGTPDDTDLVKDGALAIRDLGQDIDTTTKALNPETTTGDIAYRSATANTNTRLGIGTTGQVLTVAGGVPSWATAAAATSGLTKITSATFSAVSSVSFPNDTFTATYKDYLVQINITNASANTAIQGKMRASGTDNSTSNYTDITQILTSAGSAVARNNNGQTVFTLGYINSTADQFSRAYNFISPQIATRTRVWGGGIGVNSAYNDIENDTQLLHFNATTQFDSFTFNTTSGNITGYYAVYGLEA